MSAMEPWELEAVEHGGTAGGEYLDSIGKSDLAKLTKEEWIMFLECVCKEYHARHTELAPRK